MLFRIKLLIGVLLTLFVVSCSTQNKKKIDIRVLDDSSKVSILSQVDMKRYIGKNVKDVTRDKTLRYYIGYDFIESKPYSLSGLLLKYSDNVTIEIRCNNIKYQKAFSATSDWRYDLLLKETVSRIYLYNNYTLIKKVQ